MATATVWIDGTDVTNISLEGEVSRRLNRPASASVRLPLDQAIGGAGSRLKVAFNGELFFHGFILLCETEADEDVGYVTYNATDPTEIWQWRPARDIDGDYTKPDLMQIFGIASYGAAIVIEQMMLNSEEATASADLGVPDGTLFIDHSLGSGSQFPIGGVDVSGMPADWPMSMAEVATMLVNTGALDIVINPVDYSDFMAIIKCYNSEYPAGVNRTGQVIMEHATGARNIRTIRHVEDMSNSVQKLRYLLGPRQLSKHDPKGDQHWAASIEGTFDAVTSARQVAARSIFGNRFEVKIWDGDEDEAFFLWRRLWQIEAYLRAVPQRMTYITPIRGFPIPYVDPDLNTANGSFDIGDTITVNAPLIVNRPTPTTDFDGVGSVQRVYGYTVSWDDDSVLTLSELEASPSQEGFGG
jgi:hypothetical protein